MAGVDDASHTGPSCGARPDGDEPVRASRWRWCSTPTRSAPACSGRRWSPRAPRDAESRPGAARRRAGGVVGARRAERGLHRRLPARERAAAAPRPPAQQSTLDALVEGAAPNPRSRPRRARCSASARAGGRVRRGAVRRVAGGAARRRSRTGSSGAGSLALARARRALLRAARRRAARPRTSWSTCCARTRPVGSGSPPRRRASPASRPPSCWRRGRPTPCPARSGRGRRDPSGCPRCCSAATRRSRRCWSSRRSARCSRSRRTSPTPWSRRSAALLAHDGSAKHAAEALYCHRNTVIYRTRQIEELTGLRLSDPRDKLLLTLGLLAQGD